MLEKSVIDEAVQSVWAAEGYLKEDGTRNMLIFREREAEILEGHAADTKKDRATQAITINGLVMELFPRFVTPDKLDDDADSELPEAVLKVLASKVKAETRLDSPLQLVIHEHMGNGYFALSTKVSKDRIDAVYISHDLGCCLDDGLTPHTASLERKANKVAGLAGKMIERQPENASKYAKHMDSTVKAITSHTDAEMTLAIEMAAEAVATANGTPGDDGYANAE